MNEFEHFVLHVAFVMAGLIAGMWGVGAILWSVLRFQNRPPRPLMTQRSDAERAGLRKQRHLGFLAVASLAVAIAALAKRHLIEPLWLEDLTPFEHFLLHVGFVVIGAIIGVSGLVALVWSIQRRLHIQTEQSWFRAAKGSSKLPARVTRQ